MEATKKPLDVPPQFREILRFQTQMTRKSGRPISLSEAIASWIALGFAEEYRDKHFQGVH